MPFAYVDVDLGGLGAFNAKMYSRRFDACSSAIRRNVSAVFQTQALDVAGIM